MLRLQYERRRQGLIQRRVARAVFLYQSDLSLIENGRLIPTDAQLQRLADVLQFQPASKLLEHVVVVREAR